jgi:hypothetical protein
VDEEHWQLLRIIGLEQVNAAALFLHEAQRLPQALAAEGVGQARRIEPAHLHGTRGDHLGGDAGRVGVELAQVLPQLAEGTALQEGDRGDDKSA